VEKEPGIAFWAPYMLWNELKVLYDACDLEYTSVNSSPSFYLALLLVMQACNAFIFHCLIEYSSHSWFNVFIWTTPFSF